MSPPKESILHMNIDPELKKKLRELAVKDNRTLSNFVETALRRLVENNNGSQVQ